MENPSNFQNQTPEQNVSSSESDIAGTNPSENSQSHADAQFEALKLQSRRGFRARIVAFFKKCGEALGFSSADEIVEQADDADQEHKSDNDLPDNFGLSRRKFMVNTAGIVGLAVAGLAIPSSNARADYNPYQKKLTPVLEADYKGKILPPETLSPKEKILLNEGMKVLWRTYLHFDFWHTLTTDAPGVQKVLETAMAKENRTKLWYRGSAKGVMTIQNRTKDIPEVNIEISFGKVTKVNGVKINHSPLRRYDEDWKVWNKRIERISPKVALLNQLAGEPEASTVPPITDVEWGWYYQYSFEWPHRFLKLLQLKGDLTEDETRLKNLLESLLVNHPKSEADYLKNLEERKRTALVNPTMPIPDPPPASQPASGPATQPASAAAPQAVEENQDIPEQKGPQLIVWRRKRVERRNETSGTTSIHPKTPDDMVELVLFSDIARRAIAGISQDGFVMVWRNRKWVKSDASAMPFVPRSR
jgi:hypothetical protein